MKKLTINEQIFLIAILRLDDQAYGLKIREEVMELTGNRILFGTIYNTLEYLKKKNYIQVREGNPEIEKQDSKRVYYLLTKEGLEALESARTLQSRLWKGIPDFSHGEGTK